MTASTELGAEQLDFSGVVQAGCMVCRSGTTSSGDVSSRFWGTWIISGLCSFTRSTPGWCQPVMIRPSGSGIGRAGLASAS